MSETAGGIGGSKSVVGSTGWTNYVLEGDVRRNASGPNANPGLLFRMTDPDVGTDALNGYYVGVGATGVLLGRMTYGWTQLAGPAAIPGGSPTGAWIRVRVEVDGCTFTISAKRADDPNAQPAVTTSTDPGCFEAGSVGVRTFDGTASWRNVTVTAS